MMIDLDEFEDLTQAIADRAAVDPAFRSRLDRAASEARRWLAEVEAYGLVRVSTLHGTVAIEMLDRWLH